MQRRIDVWAKAHLPNRNVGRDRLADSVVQRIARELVIGAERMARCILFAPIFATSALLGFLDMEQPQALRFS